MANETKRSQYEADEIITVEFEEGEEIEVHESLVQFREKLIEMGYLDPNS